METTALFGLLTQVLWLVALIVLIGVLAQIYRIVRDFANITKRVESLTDLSGWLSFFKKFKGKR